MRARTVDLNKAYVFDFDDTLVKTDAKVHIYKDGKKIKSLTPEEYNFYTPAKGESTNMDDFIDPRIIMNARKYKMWPALKNIDMAKKSGRSNSDIYILTARSPKAQLPIHAFLTREGIEISLENVITLGRDDGSYYDIAGAKKKVLGDMADEYDQVLFYDDSHKNIELANKIPGIKSRLIDSTTNENVQQAKKILADKGIDADDENYQKLSKVLEKSPGLMGKFTKWMYDGTPFWKLRNTYQMHYLKAKQKNIQLGNINSFNSFEEFKQNLDEAFEAQWRKQFATGIPKEVSKLFDEKIWDLLRDSKQTDDEKMFANDKIAYIKKFLQTWGRRYKSSDTLYNVMEDELATYRNIRKKEFSNFFNSFNPKDAEVVYEDDKNLLIEIKTFKAMDAAQKKHYISQSFCFGEEEVWCNLVSNEENAQQYFWYNYNFDFRDSDFMITFTVEDGKVTRIGTATGEVNTSEDWDELNDEILKQFGDKFE